MRLRPVAAAVLALAALAVTSVACAPAAEEDDHDHASEAVSTKNMGRQDFGLRDRELILTLDDGPGAKTKTLVDYLVKKQVPAVFFMVGRNADANKDAVEYVARKSAEVPGGLIVANHSFTHTTPLPKQGVEGSVNEIMNTDRVIAPYIAQSQRQFGQPISFFRPPYGAFTALGEANIAKVNERGASKYVGPIFWEIGGELANGYAADWACWGKVDIATCQKGYVAEAKARQKGIVLLHDVHNRTVDMLVGDEASGRKGLIEELQESGFRFVGLREHEDAIRRLAPQANVENLRVETFPSNGSIDVVAEAYGNASTVLVSMDNGDAMTFNRASDSTGSIPVRTRFSVGPGQHVLHIVALDERRNELARKDVGFVVAADLTDGNGAKSEGSSPCVNYDRLYVGRTFDMFHKRVDCGASGAQPAPDGVCYRYKAVATVSRAPQAVGGNEWSVEYSLGYEGHPEDRSTLSAILETGTGDILTGKRTFPAGSGRQDYTFDESKVDCSKGIWRGNFILPSGSLEEFRFSKPGQ